MGEFSHIPTVFDNVSLLRMLHFFFSQVWSCVNVLFAVFLFTGESLTYFALIFPLNKTFFFVVVTFPLNITTTSSR